MQPGSTGGEPMAGLMALLSYNLQRDGRGKKTRGKKGNMGHPRRNLLLS